MVAGAAGAGESGPARASAADSLHRGEQRDIRYADHHHHVAALSLGRPFGWDCCGRVYRQYRRRRYRRGVDGELDPNTGAERVPIADLRRELARLRGEHAALRSEAIERLKAASAREDIAAASQDASRIGSQRAVQRRSAWSDRRWQADARAEAAHDRAAASADGHPDGLAERERIADERDRIADERDRIADQRDRIADEREHRADDREEIADARDHHVDQRDWIADERDRLADDRDRQLLARDLIADRRDAMADDRDALAYQPPLRPIPHQNGHRSTPPE